MGQAFLLASPKTALALLTSILSKVCIERHKCNSERENAAERAGKKGEGESKPKGPTEKNNSKTSKWSALAITVSVSQASQKTDSQATLWCGTVSLND